MYEMAVAMLTYHVSIIPSDKIFATSAYRSTIVDPPEIDVPRDLGLSPAERVPRGVATDPESNPGNSLRNSKASYFPFSGRLSGYL